MKKFILKHSSLIVTVALLVIAVGLILTSAIGGTRAALTYFSNTYSAHVEMYDIGVSLLEESDKDSGSHVVASRDYVAGSNGQWSMSQVPLLENMLGEDEKLEIGKTYKEALSVSNSGTINEYVRVKVYKYWTDENGKKTTTLSPKLIQLNWANLGSDWILESENDECAVLYYNKLLSAGSTTSAFTDELTVYIDDSIKAAVHKDVNGNVITYTYDYDGYNIKIEAEVDAVQEHNAQDAILSAWGVNASVSGGSLSIY